MSGLLEDQVTILSITAGLRRSGTVVQFSVTAQPVGDLSSKMTQSGAGGFGDLFVAAAASRGVVTPTPSVMDITPRTRVDTKREESD